MKWTVHTRKIGILVVIMAVIVIGLTIPTKTSHACSCIEISVEEAFEQSDAVFSGKVIEIIDSNKNNRHQSSIDRIDYIFEVDETWKGFDKKEVIVTSVRSGASCGFQFQLNEHYLVYGTKLSDDDFRTGLCTRTASVINAKEDLAFLGEGERPTGLDDQDLNQEVNQVGNHNDASTFDKRTQEVTPKARQFPYATILGIIIIALILIYLQRRHNKKR